MMSQTEQKNSAEQRLLLDIEKLRRAHSNTLELYVALAHLLFFKYDSIPTTNRMYQLVRRGSMGTPAQALKIFWTQLREQAQVRMQKAALPEELLRSAEQL
ncbi:MAG TPA: DNA-binding protein, partial [Paenalcaligenes sp.]|nr:DNA-binding protein [Paenalcaligenes sp.]